MSRPGRGARCRRALAAALGAFALLGATSSDTWEVVTGKYQGKAQAEAERLAAAGDTLTPELRALVRDPVGNAFAYGSGLTILLILVLMIFTDLAESPDHPAAQPTLELEDRGRVHDIRI